mmetsp:Transcript_21682/g.45821  ORF Transcript_21682/g.45821 Transcript_21682/m.45821 type:complete len:383 (-) Transcript_21682:277-1425(-)
MAVIGSGGGSDALTPRAFCLRANGKMITAIVFRVMVVCCLSISLMSYNSASLLTGKAALLVGRATNNTEEDDYQLAKHQSYGFFYDIPALKWELLREIYRTNSNHRDPKKPMEWSKSERFRARGGGDAPWYQNHYEPNFSCMHEKRVGLQMNGDGPKWVCDPHRIRKLALERKARDPNHPGCVVYSIGSNGDINFEMGMQKEIGEDVCEYHIFDPGDYAATMPKELKRGNYHQWGLAKQNDDPNTSAPNPNTRFQGLLDIVKMLGHENLDVIDIFKIDCEKCEWETYSDWLAPGIPVLHQILVEVHGVPNTAPFFFDTLERAGYVRFHKEPNIQFNPGCIEYAMLKVDTQFMNGKTMIVGNKMFQVIDGNYVESLEEVPHPA